MKSWHEVQKELKSTKDAGRRRIEFVHAKKSSNSHKTASNASKGNSAKGNKRDLSDGIYPMETASACIKWSDVRRAGPGMYNHGNTCFLNSTLQCLVHIPPLVQIFLTDPKAVSGLTRTEGQNAAISILFKKYGRI
jgi:ubiquitin C-terminal hydrolase